MKKIIISISTIALLFLFGCASKNAKYVEAGGARTIISTKKINMADWNNAATALVNDMLASNAIDKTKLNLPAKILVSRVVNRTSNMIDTDLLTTQICIALQKSGKAIPISTDKTTTSIQGAQVAQLTITGKIIEDRESNSDMDEVTYVFFLYLNWQGQSIWIGQKQIAKQSEKGWF